MGSTIVHEFGIGTIGAWYLVILPVVGYAVPEYFEYSSEDGVDIANATVASTKAAYGGSV
jgi:hypothetical protein